MRPFMSQSFPQRVRFRQQQRKRGQDAPRDSPTRTLAL